MTKHKTQAIETFYNKTRFRSRLEAKWALFFDELGIMWDYECQGFETAGIKYLPDFYLPELDFFFEVKPYAPTWKDILKSAVCPYVSGTTILLSWGPPIIPVEEEHFDMVDCYREYLASQEHDKCLDVRELKIPSKIDRHGCVAICSESARVLIDGSQRLPIVNRQFAPRSMITADIKRCPSCKKCYFGTLDGNQNYDDSILCPFDCESNDAYQHVVAAATKVRNHRFGKIA